MRIAIISTPFVAVPPPRYGGTELIVAALVDRLVARGHDVSLYATGDSTAPGRLRFTYREAVWPPNTYRELVHASCAVTDLLGREPVDVVHAHVPAALAFGRLLDAPLVYTLHHVYDPVLGEVYERLSAPHTTMVCISERQRNLAGLGAGARVVHHGLEATTYPFGLGSGGYVAFVGRFSEEKGVAVAIDAALDAGLPIRLGGRPHWMDDDYFRKEVEPRLSRPGVTWLGEVSPGPKASVLASALATVFPIAWEEPFGLVMIESMLCGTPVLSYPRGAAPEVIDEGVTGWLVADRAEMSERLRRLADGRDRIDRVACRAHAARRFGADRMVDDYLAIYRAAQEAMHGTLAHAEDPR